MTICDLGRVTGAPAGGGGRLPGLRGAERQVTPRASARAQLALDAVFIAGIAVVLWIAADIWLALFALLSVS